MRLLGASDRRLAYPVFIAFAVLIIFGTALSFLVNTQSTDHAAVAHTMGVKEALTATRLAVYEAETGMRGYVITGRDDFVEPFNRAKDMLPLLIANVQTLTADNPRQQQNAARIKPLAERMLATLQNRVDIYRTQGQAIALKSITGESQLIADQVNALITAMIAEEDRLLRERQAASERTATIVQALAIVTLLLAVVFGSLNAVEAARRQREIETGHAALAASHERLKAEVSEREAVELQLRQAQKMEAVGQLTGGVAHDFNNMLAVVIGALDIARRRLTAGDANIVRFLDNAIEGAQRGATLTQRLLAFSRQQALDPKVVDANKLVTGLSDLLRRILGENILIEIVHGGGLWRVHADYHQLESALVNLAVNARDAMPTGGRLTIETENAVLDERYAANHGIMPGDYVMISVTDTGTGMTPDVVSRAFDPFFTTKAVGQGTGLGLSQVFGFVKQSGGHVKIYSEVGQGTSVKIFLPRRGAGAGPAEDGAPKALSRELASHAPGVVLVVEDDDTVQLLTIASVEELGFTVLHASNAMAAMEILKQRGDIALLLTDVVMPGITGRQLAEEALKLRPALNVLYTTGYTRNAIVHNGALDPGVHLLSKPYTLEQLSAAIARVMEN